MISARNRDLSRRKALRKRRIANEIYRNHDSQGEYLPYYDNLHQYQKIKSIVPALAVLPRLAIKASVDRLRMVGTLLKTISIAICAS